MYIAYISKLEVYVYGMHIYVNTYICIYACTDFSAT